MPFSKGDRVRIARGKFAPHRNADCWQIGSTGTVTKAKYHPEGDRSHGGHCGDDCFDEGSAHQEDKAGHEGYIGVRWDNYDYGGSPSNCHTACSYILELELDEPTDEEFEEALRSIAEAAGGLDAQR